MKTDNVGQGIYPPYRQNPDRIEQYSSRAGTVYQRGGVGTGYDTSRPQHNRPVFETSVDVSIDIGNRSMRLLLQAAVEHVNQAMSREFGRDVARHPGHPGPDFTPRAVADRIVSLSTSFFDEYRDLYPKKDMDAALQSFVRLIGGGIDKGFDEARDILDGLGALKGNVAENIDKTYEYVQSGLQAFVDDYPSHGNYPPRGDYPPHGNYPPYGGYPPHGNYPPYGGYPPHGNYPPYGNYPPQGGYPPYGHYPPYGNFPPQGPYPPQGGYPHYDTGPGYGNFPRHDIGPMFGDYSRYGGDRVHRESHGDDARPGNISSHGDESRREHGPSSSGEVGEHSDSHRGDEKSGHKDDD